MYCSNCGAENEDGAVFCSNCGKSPKDVVVKDKEIKRAKYPLINLSSKLFYPIFEVCLWINLIVCAVGGGIASYNLTGGRWRGGNPIPGVIIGLLVGFICIIIFGGLISIFLRMNENIEKIEKKV